MGKFCLLQVMRSIKTPGSPDRKSSDVPTRLVPACELWVHICSWFFWTWNGQHWHRKLQSTLMINHLNQIEHMHVVDTQTVFVILWGSRTHRPRFLIPHVAWTTSLYVGVLMHLEPRCLQATLAPFHKNSSAAVCSWTTMRSGSRNRLKSLNESVCDAPSVSFFKLSYQTIVRLTSQLL